MIDIFSFVLSTADTNDNPKFTPAEVELKLVQSLDDIREAKIVHKAAMVPC